MSNALAASCAALTLFNYNGSQVRTILDERTGEPWWVAKDVCDVLGLGWTGTTLRHLLPSEKGCERIATPGGPQNTSIINKDGLYRLIFRSDKPIAEDFRTWIIKVVLPAVEKYGVPTAPQNPTALGLPDFTDPAASAVAWAEQYSARKALEERNVVMVEKVEELEVELKIAEAACDVLEGVLSITDAELEDAEAKLEEAAPKVEFYDTLVETGANLSLSAASKQLGVDGLGPLIIFDFLRELGWLSNKRLHGPDRNLPNQWVMKKGYMDVKYSKKFQDKAQVAQPYITPKGLAWLVENLSLPMWFAEHRCLI